MEITNDLRNIINLPDNKHMYLDISIYIYIYLHIYTFLNIRARLHLRIDAYLDRVISNHFIQTIPDTWVEES